MEEYQARDQIFGLDVAVRVPYQPDRRPLEAKERRAGEFRPLKRGELAELNEWLRGLVEARTFTKDI